MGKKPLLRAVCPEKNCSAERDDKMSVQAVREYLEKFGYAERISEFSESTATVELAAAVVGVIPARIAKTLSFKVQDGVILVGDDIDKISGLLIAVSSKSSINCQCVSCDCCCLLTLGVAYFRVSGQSSHKNNFIHTI